MLLNPFTPSDIVSDLPPMFVPPIMLGIRP
jgi:hypothetical protein